jgi:hypothetical protein
MEDPYDKSLPKYMNVQGQTKFELAQSIDSAIYAAEQVVSSDQQRACYQLWCDQLSDLLQSEFKFELPELDAKNAHAMCEAVETLLERCKLQFKLKLAHNAPQETFQTAMKVLLERGLMDTLDLMQTQGLWQFSLQQKLHTTQERLIGLIYQMDY